ncbi:hypothetical protein LMG27174_01296 [Paraburkholderia rhynchosiae]|uniref:Uncharacterized protein n=1 Tax=Paraburkholderia rhynchosiae TaxID=487049 RepID=A0A2N7WIC9_9BURK|nr:hypothetical protein C0Z16_20385 [Paraburkholderia rhynchosiae]CAB3653943.1 hypothetical protein LMG27174_01296 [Paraburkholderia rhynchosiae]
MCRTGSLDEPRAANGAHLTERAWLGGGFRCVGGWFVLTLMRADVRGVEVDARRLMFNACE